MLASVLQRLRDVWGGLNTIVKVGGTLTALIGIVATLYQTYDSMRDGFAERAAVREHLAIADRQLSEKDYAAAWVENAKVLKLEGKHEAALDQRTRIAMRWLENARVSDRGSGPRTFTELTRPLEDALLERSPKLRDADRAEVEAHIGWARFLRSRDSAPSIDVDGPLDTALRLDPGNATAHAVKGFWQMWRRKSPTTARLHFDAALASKHDGSFTDNLIILAWLNFSSSDDELALGAVDYANRIRKLGRLHRIETSIKRLYPLYFDGLRRPAYLARLDGLMPASDHLEMLAMLDQTQLSNSERLAVAALRAHYLEQSGSTAEARQLYEKVVADMPEFADQRPGEFAKAGLRRLAH